MTSSAMEFIEQNTDLESTSQFTRKNYQRGSAMSHLGRRTQASTISLTFGGDSMHNHHSLNRYHLVSAQKHLRERELQKSLQDKKQQQKREEIRLKNKETIHTMKSECSSDSGPNQRSKSNESARLKDNEHVTNISALN